MLKSVRPHVGLRNGTTNTNIDITLECLVQSNCRHLIQHLKICKQSCSSLTGQAHLRLCAKVLMIPGLLHVPAQVGHMSEQFLKQSCGNGLVASPT